MDGELEIITATGAAVHALQVLNKEIEPYVNIVNRESSSSSNVNYTSAIPSVNYIQHLEQVIAGTQSPDPETQMSALTEICKIFSSSERYLIDGLVEYGVIPILLEYLQNSK